MRDWQNANMKMYGNNKVTVLSASFISNAKCLTNKTKFKKKQHNLQLERKSIK